MMARMKVCLSDEKKAEQKVHPTGEMMEWCLVQLMGEMMENLMDCQLVASL